LCDGDLGCSREKLSHGERVPSQQRHQELRTISEDRTTAGGRTMRGSAPQTAAVVLDEGDRMGMKEVGEPRLVLAVKPGRM